MVVNGFDVFLVNFDPTEGAEIKKTRPSLIISPNEMNRHISTVIIAPMTSKGRNYPTKVNCKFQEKDGQIILDQIRTIDKSRLVSLLGQIDKTAQRKVLLVLREMFSQ